MRKVVAGLILGLFLSHFAFAQANDSIPKYTISINSELVSQYVWRGLMLSNAPSIQSSITYNKKGFSLGVWGASSLNFSEASEVDLFASYSIQDRITLTVTDYFVSTVSAPNHYFNYKSEQTGHIFELTASYAGGEKLPLSLLVASNVYGADAVRYDKNGEYDGIQYSSYAEIGYSFKNCDAFMGFNLTTPNTERGETGFYGSSFGVVNLGITATKKIKITKDFSLPLKASFITNPQAENIFLVVGLGL